MMQSHSGKSEEKKNKNIMCMSACAGPRIYVVKSVCVCVPNGHNYQHQNPARICRDHTFCFLIIHDHRQKSSPVKMNSDSCPTSLLQLF